MKTLLDRAMAWIRQRYDEAAPHSLGTECWELMQEYVSLQKDGVVNPLAEEYRRKYADAVRSVALCAEAILALPEDSAHVVGIGPAYLVPHGAYRKMKVNARNLYESSMALSEQISNDRRTSHPDNVSTDGPPGTDMEVRREAARWRWARAMCGVTPEAMMKATMVAKAAALGLDCDKAIDAYIASGVPTAQEIATYTTHLESGGGNAPVPEPPACDCECHVPGKLVFHAIPCCDYTYEKRDKS